MQNNVGNKCISIHPGKEKDTNKREQEADP